MADGTAPGPSPAACTQIPPHTLIGGPENLKVLFDDELDNRRAWNTIVLEAAQIANRRAQNAATFDHAINAALVIATQVGQTEGQQTVSPEGTAASEAIKGGVGVAAEQVSANIADLATIVKAIVGEVFAAVLPFLVNAAGGASTPSQTKAPADA